MSISHEPSTNHVVATPGTCGGAPRIAGTRIRVSQIVRMTKQGMSPDEIITSLQHLTLGQVYGALSYYHDHRETIDREIRNTDEEYARFRAGS